MVLNSGSAALRPLHNGEDPQQFLQEIKKVSVVTRQRHGIVA